MKTEKKWEPKELSDVEIAFSTRVEDMMPAYKDIPEEFGMNSTGKWNKLVTDIFYRGLKKLDLTPKPGIDKNKAFRHIQAVLRSWEPKHEHKTAACAFLFNEWFEDATWEAADLK